ncbi:MAG: hypothetical protein J3K34DRAFT_522166 [Monoraphidium minutum]|nr:MAG: hypothetical protein J3K34DRAFT_522166 [Monoraphidium minutum]
MFGFHAGRAARPPGPATRRGTASNRSPSAAPARAPRRRRGASAAAAAAPASAAPALDGAARGPLQTDARQLAALLPQLARLEVRPHAQWLEEALSVVERQAAALGPDELCGFMHALASWGFHPGPGLLAAVEGAALGIIAARGFSGRQLAELAWAYAQLSLPRGPVLAAVLSESEALMLEGTCPPEAMADLLWAMARLQHAPLEPRWLSAFYAASAPRLREFDAQQMARAAWALARLGAAPPAAWVDGFLAASLAGLRGFDVKSTSLTLWALATLKARPGAAWLRAFEGAAESQAKHLGAAEAATALWALSQLTGRPPQELRLSAALRRPQRGLSQLDYELLSDLRMLRVVKSMITGNTSGGGAGSASGGVEQA